jgi:hydroxylamine reductase (hybrid-cluster protein)
VNKAQLIRQIVASLRESLGVLEKAARASHAEATHESSKAESKYDTRGLEAAYLAGGQARQAKEILDSIKLYEILTTRNFAAHEPIDLSAAHNAAKAASASLVTNEMSVRVVITDVRKSDQPPESSVVKVPTGSGASKIPGRSIKSTLQLR